MKKFYLPATILLIALVAGSCDKLSSFDRLLLVGKWESGTLFDRYFANGTGYSWDEGDDVGEDEAQKFDWTLEDSELTRFEHMEISGVKIPKIYTITELTSTRLSYKDDFGRSYSFTKVKE
jgi:hypothetical protein